MPAVPGRFTGPSMHKWGHMRLRALLNREPPFPAAFRGAALAAQFSSLGSLDDKWLGGEFRDSLAAGRCEAGGGGGDGSGGWVERTQRMVLGSGRAMDE